MSRPLSSLLSVAKLSPYSSYSPLTLFSHIITSLAAVKMSYRPETAYYYHPYAGPQSRDSYYITPARTPTKKSSRVVVVKFVPASNTICRPARDDERDVMRRFAAHASHCPRCKDLCRVYREGGTLCERGHAHARDVA
jgi:hypothetical protein